MTRDQIEHVYLEILAAILTVKHRVQDFRELNAHTRSLNAVAPRFFARVESLLLGESILALTRVTDGKEYRGNPHVSVQLLSALPGAPACTVVLASMKGLRDIRNNWISHTDLSKSLAKQPATVTLKEIEDAIVAIEAWLRDFASYADLPMSDPVDQGTWLSAENLTAALRDAEAVHNAYLSLLSSPTKERAAEIDQQLTDNRLGWEESPFDESRWIVIKRVAIADGANAALLHFGQAMPYSAILLQVLDPDQDITRTMTDRRVAARIRSEADWVLREIQKRSGLRVTGLGTEVY